MLKTYNNQSIQTKLVSHERYFKEMVKLYNINNFPKVMLLSGKKGIGKFTLVFHFLNYIYSINEINKYDVEERIINTNSLFYNSILKNTCPDVIFFRAEEGKNIKIDDVRKLKSTLSNSSLSNNPRFIIIDEVEFLNSSSVNALLKTLEEPTNNNFFILINNQQTKLIETISSRCIKNNIFINSNQRKKIVDYLIKDYNINLLLDDSGDLTPGLLLAYNDLSTKYKISKEDSILSKISKLLHAYKKDKNKNLINISLFLIDLFFYNLIKKNSNNIEILLNLKSSIINKINEFNIYNLNINLVMNFIESNLKHVK